MGACLNTHSYKYDLGKPEILKLWKQAVETSQWESGHSYSGCIGMLHGDPEFHDLNLKSEDEANMHITENHEKWLKPLAVSYNETQENGWYPPGKYWMIGGWCSS